MFVQIGNQAFNPDLVFRVDFRTHRYWHRPHEGDELIEELEPRATLYDVKGDWVEFSGEDYDAFMDWWTRCANVSRFPSRRSITPSLTEDQVRHAQGLEAKMMAIRSQDAPSLDEWEEVSELEEELAEMFCNVLPTREEPCST
jgi:hypothetical protein